MDLENDRYKIYFGDAVEISQKEIPSNSVDLIITDPPFGIDFVNIEKMYARKKDLLVDNYVEIDKKDYYEFSNRWIKESERILKPGGSIYIFSGYTNLIHILNSLVNTNLKEINHIIWHYNFGVYTKRKFVSSHYHILYYVKPGKRHLFNLESRFRKNEKKDGLNLNYSDRQDVWYISREFGKKNDKIKNRNNLPNELIKKIIQYSSNENDIILDFFSGSFAVGMTALSLNRKFIGIEINKNCFEMSERLKKWK